MGGWDRARISASTGFPRLMPVMVGTGLISPRQSSRDRQVGSGWGELGRQSNWKNFPKLL